MKAIMAQKSPRRQGAATGLLERLCLRLMKCSSSGGRGKNCLKAGAEAWLQLHFQFFCFFFGCLDHNLSQCVGVYVCGCTPERSPLYINTGVVWASVASVGRISAGKFVTFTNIHPPQTSTYFLTAVDFLRDYSLHFALSQRRSCS